MSDALLAAADGPNAEITGNGPINVERSAEFLNEIGLAADGLASLNGPVSSLDLSGAVSSDAGATPFPERTCELCALPLERRRNESNKAWRQRRFCDHTCSNNAQVGKRHYGRPEARSFGGGSFPEAKDRGREAALYGAERYDSPGRTVILAASRQKLPTRPQTWIHSEIMTGAR